MGTGPEWLFCFHGYGELGSSFNLFEELLGRSYTLVSIDFPYHGETDWQEGLLFDVPDLINIINLIKPAEQPFSIMGYSMGGRVALQLLQTIPSKINSLLLVAPDGLHKNKWQWLSTKTIIGKRLFAYTMKNPSWIMGLLPVVLKLGIFNKSLLKFVRYYLDDAAQREILYRRWITMRKFSPNKTLLKECIINNKIPVSLVFGKYDRIIISKHGWAFRKNAESYITVTELEAGHLLLREKYAHLIAELIKP
jgi:pimeloyl-ACP methyl ester carboxylesterase